MLDQDANRELFEEQVELIFKSFNERAFAHQGKHYTHPAPGALPGLRARGDHAGAAAEDAARRVLAAGGQREPAGAGLHGQARHPRASSAAARRRAGPTRRSSTPSARRGARAGRESERWARASASGFSFHIADSVEAGHQGGHAVLRGEHQDVRPARLRARPHARADRGGGRPEARRVRPTCPPCATRSRPARG